MTPDPPTDDRLADLRRRWEEDPGSRIFLQLAEEYRKAERHDDAVEVLTKGLEAHPNQVSALVALGRNRLALGQPGEAAEALEKAVEMDATNLAAMKLSVEAYLQQGDRDSARQRLELYKLLNEGDEEVEELERRLAQRPAPPPSPPPPAGTEDEAEAGEVEETPAPAGEPAPSAPDTWSPTNAWPALPKEGELEGEGQRESPAGAAAPPAARADDEPFAGLLSPAERDLYLAGLRSEGLFAFETEVEEEDEAGHEEAAAEAEDGAGEPSADVPDERPTVTLGNLYLEQGHYREAGKIFEALLRANPEHAEARAGLLRARAGAARAAAETAAAPETTAAPPPAAEPPSSETPPSETPPLETPSPEPASAAPPAAAPPPEPGADTAFEVGSLAGLESAARETAASERAGATTAATAGVPTRAPSFTLTAETLLAEADPSLPPRVGVLRAYLRRIRNP